MRKFFSCSNGNVAIVFGITLVPVFGLIGAALDFGRALQVRSHMQHLVDATALNAAVGGLEVDTSQLLNGLRSQLEERFGATGVITDLKVTGAWDGPVDFVVDAEASVATAMVHILPGIDNALKVSTLAVARLDELEITYEPPVAVQLEPDAGDFNEIYAYCFRSDQMGPPQTRRKSMTLIADNEGNTYNNWPKCGEKETLSFRLRNVRHVRAYPHLWDNANQSPYRAEYDFYTDTVIVDGVEHIDIKREVAWIPPQWEDYHDPGGASDGDFNILETIRCDSLEACKPEKEGGLIPEGKNRTPNVEDRSCQPGKYMYYGWEDRPPGQPGPSKSWTDPAWTDRSYDDIRIVMKCPTTGVLGQRNVRLIR